MASRAKSKMNMREIAKATGVSVATVSYVLNGKGGVSLEKQREIREILREAGYKPKHYRYPIFYISDYQAIRDAGGIIQFADRIAGLNMVFHEQDIAFRSDFVRMNNASPLQKQLDEILLGKPGGIIVDDNFEDQCEFICDFFESRQIPVVQIGFLPYSVSYDACVVDNFAGGYLAGKYFLEQGHQHIATIRWNVDGDPASIQKFAGFQSALQEAGRRLPEEYVISCEVSRKEHDKIPGREAAMRLAGLANPPTAVFVENSYISPSILYPINGLERDVPEVLKKMDIIHFEAWDLTAARQLMGGKLDFKIPPAKILKINWEELGRMAATRIINRLVAPSISPGEVARLAPKLIQW